MNSKITIGIDRDGTINRDLGTYVTDPKDFEPIPGSLEAITMMKEKGYNIVVITNQAGIMKGILTSEQVDNVHLYMLELLGKSGCKMIDGIYYSTTNLKDDFYAKPNIGMFKKAEIDLRIKFKNGFYVGDKITDLKAAEKARCRPILVKTGYGEETIEKLKTFSNRKLRSKVQIYDNLWNFAESLPRSGNV